MVLCLCMLIFRISMLLLQPHKLHTLAHESPNPQEMDFQDWGGGAAINHRNEHSCYCTRTNAIQCNLKSAEQILPDLKLE